jgi:hypothetical protein
MGVTDAAQELYGAPLRAFAAERKRLAEAAPDKRVAREIAKLPRPSMAAWVVNRLWREAQGDMEALFEAGARMRAGESGAWDQQRALLSSLGARGRRILESDRHAASPATMRRVTSTLQSLSAAGGFGPEEAGQLVVDRDAPGFEALGGALPPPPERAPARKKLAPVDAKPARPTKADRLAQANAEREQKRVDKARRRADALDDEVRDLRAEVARADKALARVRAALAEKEAALAAARDAIDD